MINHKLLEQYLTWASHFKESESLSQHVGCDSVSLACLFGLPGGVLQVSCCVQARGTI